MTRFLIALGLALTLAACGHGKSAKANADAGAAFLAQNAHAPGVMLLPSGVQYKIVTSGPADGPHPQPADEVKVNYEGKLLSGKVFDSSFERGVPASFPLNTLIPAWIEAMQRMRPGDEWILFVPPAQGYGDQDQGEIPPNSVLIFRIQLLGVLPRPAEKG
jgi:peptidylprolyl isomerase/FKBP-type peptidyl-prolyl cis-trans isomerase FklB